MEKNIDYVFNEVAAETIRKYRNQKGLSLEDVVKKMKNPISRQSLFKYEHNMARMKNKIFIDICTALNLEADDIFEEINNIINEREKNNPFAVLFEDNSTNEKQKEAKKTNFLEYYQNEEHRKIDNDINNINNIYEKIDSEIKEYLNLDFEYFPSTEAEVNFGFEGFSMLILLLHLLISIEILKDGQEANNIEIQNAITFINNNKELVKSKLEKEYQKHLQQWNEFKNSKYYEDYVKEIES